MTKKFEKKIIRQGAVDTKKYRYIYYEDISQGAQIKRLPLDALDTTAAIDGWETVKVIS